MTVAEYFLPTTVTEATDLLRLHGPDLLVIAGGTLVMPRINEGISMPRQVMGLRRTSLDTIEPTSDGQRVGATATLTTVAEQDQVPLLAEAARHTASWSVRNLATVGGNLFAPPPGGDVATALLALDAVLEVAGPTAAREIPIGEFFTGYLTNALEPSELVTGIRIPSPNKMERSRFLKFGRRHANTPSVATVAARVWLSDGVVTDVRLALGAVGPHPTRVKAAEHALTGSPIDAAAIELAAKAAVDASDPRDDAIATASYRRRMVGVMVRRVLEGFSASEGGTRV